LGKAKRLSLTGSFKREAGRRGHLLSFQYKKEHMLIRSTYAVIDINAVKQNIVNIKSRLPKGVKFCAVVKADAYGHGSVMVSKAAVEAGAEWLGVAIPEEAAVLRDEGITAPILVLGPSNRWQWEKAADLDLSMVVASEDCVINAAETADKYKKKMMLHLKVDTGMNRVGIKTFGELNDILDEIGKSEFLILEGLMTHFAAADEADKTFTIMQDERFRGFIKKVKERGFMPPIIHAANSGAAIDCPELAYDMVRAGIAMYGCYPSNEVDKSLKLTPAMSVYTKISHIKTVQPGEKLSYGCTFTTPHEMRIATLPIGYADGFNRLLSNSGEVLICGKRAKVVGRVCMDQTLVDVTDIPDADRGGDAVIIGRQGKDEITADEFAARCGTINYEILCAISPRVPRLYYENNK
jgi:alanine racemase